MSVTSFATATPPFGQGRIPVESVLRAVDDGLEGNPDLRDVGEGDCRPGDRPGRLDPMRVVLDREIAGHLDLTVVPDLVPPDLLMLALTI